MTATASTKHDLFSGWVGFVLVDAAAAVEKVGVYSSCFVLRLSKVSMIPEKKKKQGSAC